MYQAESYIHSNLWWTMYLDNCHWYSPNAAWKTYHKPEVIVTIYSFVNIGIFYMKQFNTINFY